MAQRSSEHTGSRQQETRIDSVTDRLLRKPEELELIMDIWARATESWRAEGFGPTELFIDGMSYPILVARRNTVPDEEGTEVYRLAYHGMFVEVELPRVLQGFTIRSDDGSSGYESIYTLTPEDDPISWIGQGEGLVPEHVSAELNRLRDQFGNHLGIEVTQGEYGDRRSLAYTVEGDPQRARAIDVILRHLEELKYHRDWASEEAAKVEVAAEEAARSVDTSGVVSLEGIMALQEEAYQAIAQAPARPDETWEGVIKEMKK